jgi:hypothetical protein
MTRTHEMNFADSLHWVMALQLANAHRERRIRILHVLYPAPDGTHGLYSSPIENVAIFLKHLYSLFAPQHESRVFGQYYFA